MAEIEKSGVPTVALGSRTFEHDFKASAKVFGMPGVPYAVVAERALATMQDSEIHSWVEAVIDPVVRNLTHAPQVAEEAVDGSTVSLATTLFGLEVPETEAFEGEDRLDAWKAMNRTFLKRGWGDGFPIVPPTPDEVSRMLSGTRRSLEEVVAVLPPCFGIATVEKIAVNAVMAGCEPEHLPILIAAVECMIQPGYNLRHTLMSTGPYTPMLVVNGPIAKRIGMNSGMCCLGPGAPSAVNTVIGRAVRLIVMNICGNYVGITDMDTIGGPNKYSMCLAEREEANPWEPLHVERGFDKDDSTVTVFVAGNCITHTDISGNEAIPFLKGLAATACTPGASTDCRYLRRGQRSSNNSKDLKPENLTDDCLIILGPNSARLLAREGWGKQGVKEVIHNFARVRIGDRPGSAGKLISRYGVGESGKIRPEWSWLHDYPDQEVPAYYSQDCYQIIVAGADAEKSMVVLGGEKAFTRRIEE